MKAIHATGYTIDQVSNQGFVKQTGARIDTTRPESPPGESIQSHQNGLDKNSISKDSAENSAESPLYT